jgi:hypothetical protein
MQLVEQCTRNIMDKTDGAHKDELGPFEKVSCC